MLPSFLEDNLIGMRLLARAAFSSLPARRRSGYIRPLRSLPATKAVHQLDSHHIMDEQNHCTKAPNDNCTRVLFCGLQFPASYLFTKECLQRHPNVEVDALEHEEVPNKIGRYDLCVVRGMNIDSSVISNGKRLKLLMQFGVGLEGVDIKSATEAGIKVARIPGDRCGNALSCAEHAIYLILSLLRDQKGMEGSVQRMDLGVPVGQTLFGKTVLIIGFGNIGRALATRLKPFGVHLLAIKRSWSNVSPSIIDMIDGTGNNADLLDFATRADVVVLSCHLNSETAGIINNKFLAALKKGALLVNVARGGLIDYGAVKASLEMNHLGGLGIDVAWYEPFDPTDPLLQHPKVLITPHVAGVTEMSYRNMAQIITNATLQLQAGMPISSIEGIECVN